MESPRSRLRTLPRPVKERLCRLLVLLLLLALILFFLALRPELQGVRL